MQEHDCVVLTQDVPGEALEAGDLGTIVHVHRDGEAFEVEFATITGRTITVATIPASHVRPVGAHDIAHVRELAIP